MDQHPWMTRARTQLGVAEVPGTRDAAQIVAYHSVTAAGPAKDEVAWCASFICWNFHQEGIPHTRSKSSQSYRDWGKACAVGYGAVGVIQNPIRRHLGHVGFVAGYWMDPARPRKIFVILLGGNQGNRVSLRAYPLSKFIAFRIAPGYAPGPLELVRPDGVGGSTR